MPSRKLEAVLDLKDQLTAKMRGPKSALSDLRKEAKDTGEGLGKLGQAGNLLGDALKFALVGAGAKATLELGELGARSKDTTRNLEAFAGGADEAKTFLEAVTEASGRTVDKMQATATASKFLQMGLATTTEQMGLYVEGAVRLGDQTQSSGQRIDEMTQLLKNLNINMLDNFGLSRQVIMARTEELKASQGLTREEGMLIAIQEEISRQLGVLGDRAEDGALKIDQAKTSIANLKLELAEKIAPIEIQVLIKTEEALSTWDQLWGLIRANAGYVAAELQGLADPQAIFDFEMLRAAGMAEEEAAQKAAEMAKQRMIEADATQRAQAGLGSYLPVISRGTVAQEAYKTAVELSTSGMDGWLAAMRGMPAATDAETKSLRNLATVMLSIGKEAMSLPEQMMDLIPQQALDAYKILTDEKQRLQDAAFRDMVLKAGGLADAEEQAAQDTSAAWSSAYSDAQRAAEQFDSDVRGLFQFSMNVDTTDIMDRLGFHKDTWDEWMRRAADVMNLGADSPWFQKMLDTFPRFEDLLAQFGDPRAAAAAFVNQFQQGLVPEAVNVDAIVQAYQQQLASEKAWANIYESAKQAIMNAGAGDVNESLLGQLVGGPMAEDALDDMAGGFDRVGGSVADTRSDIKRLGSTAESVLPNIDEMTDSVRRSTKGWVDQLAQARFLLNEISNMNVNFPTPPSGGGGGDTGSGDGGGGTPTPPPGSMSAGLGGGIYVGALYIANPDETFRTALSRVGVRVR